MLKRFDHARYEHVCSGIGIPHVYDYLRISGDVKVTPKVAEAIATASDPSRIILQYGLDPAKSSALCTAALDIVTSILGDEAGNLALKVLSTGGIYFAGGVATHTLQSLDSQRFMKAFTRKGRFGELLGRMPIHVIVICAALAGAAAYGLETLVPGSDHRPIPLLGV